MVGARFILGAFDGMAKLSRSACTSAVKALVQAFGHSFVPLGLETGVTDVSAPWIRRHTVDVRSTRFDQVDGDAFALEHRGCGPPTRACE